MRLAAVPSSVQKGFASQQQALEVLSQLADEAGLSSEGLHAAHLPLLLQQLLAAETEWSVHSSEWHLLQALLRQCGGDVAACQLLSLAPLFAKLLDPKRDPLLRGTVLGLLRQLLDTPVRAAPLLKSHLPPHLPSSPPFVRQSFVDSAELCEWAEHLYAAMLLPNLVWRAGKAAEHVRLAAMTCLSKLVRSDVLTPQQASQTLPPPPPQPTAVARSQLGGHCEALPVLSGCLDDDNTETRRLGCLTLEGVLSKLGPSPLSHDQMRALYPELLKRLDDANDQASFARPSSDSLSYQLLLAWLLPSSCQAARPIGASSSRRPPLQPSLALVSGARGRVQPNLSSFLCSSLFEHV